MRVLIPLLVAAVALHALATKVVPVEDRGRRVPMTVIWNLDSPADPVRTSEFRLARGEDANVLISGQDAVGRPWQAVLPAATHGIWRSKAGNTYYFAGATGGAGMAPPVWILAISFDKQRHPVPFFTVGYASYDANGIEDLLNLSGSGPQLVQQTWIEFTGIGESRWGYYATSVYEQRGIYWQQVRGPLGRRSYPAFEKWQILPGIEPTPVPAPNGLEQWLPNDSNDPSFGIAAHRGQLPVCQWGSADVLVEDTSAGRTMYVWIDANHSRLSRVKRANSPVILTGLHRSPVARQCSARIVWSGWKPGI